MIVSLNIQRRERLEFMKNNYKAFRWLKRNDYVWLDQNFQVIKLVAVASVVKKQLVR